MMRSATACSSTPPERFMSLPLWTSGLAAQPLVGHAQPPAEHLEELDRDRRVLLEQRLEVPAREHEAPRRLESMDRGRARRLVQQGHLPEEVPRTERAARPAVADDLDATG